MNKQIKDPSWEPIPYEQDNINHVNKLPKRWSPSRLNENCLRKQYYKTILELPEPQTIDTIRGHLFHAVAERIFDVEQSLRTAEYAKSLIVPQWQLMVSPPEVNDTMSEDDIKRAGFVTQSAAEVAQLVPAGSLTETELFLSVEKLVDNWFAVENVTSEEVDPSNVTFPDGTVGDGREIHVEGEVGGIAIHGFIDRLNVWKDPSGVSRVMIGDYKTGKMPPEYLLDKSFFQLRVYALAFQQMYNVMPSWLRLVYLKGTLEADKNPTPGKTQQKVTSEMLDATVADINTRHTRIVEAAQTRTWPGTTGPLCNWCYFSTICPAFNK